MNILFPIFAGVIGISIGFIVFKKRVEILSFLYPNNWNYIEMLQLDNTVLEWVQPKTNDLRFVFNKGFYNMFYSSVDKDNVVTKGSALYKQNRLSKFYYVEGNENPLDFRQSSITGNPQINFQLNKINLTDLITTEPSIMEQLFRNYGIFILGGLMLMILVIIFLLRPQTVVETVPKG